jgi:hypothetical protein
MKQSELIKLISESIKKVLKENYQDIYGNGTDYAIQMRDNADYFAQTPEEYYDRIEDAKKYLASKGEIAKTNHPQATPFRMGIGGYTGPEDCKSMDAALYTESRINKVVSETITRILKERKG